MAEPTAPFEAEPEPTLDWLHGQPYEQWERARRSGCPVVEQPAMYGHEGSSYQILSYTDAEHVLRDADTFSSWINAEHIGQFMGDLILAMNGEQHRKYRNLVAKAFRASQLEHWDETLVRPAINRLIDAIAPLGKADVQATSSRLERDQFRFARPFEPISARSGKSPPSRGQAREA